MTILRHGTLGINLNEFFFKALDSALVQQVLCCLHLFIPVEELTVVRYLFIFNRFVLGAYLQRMQLALNFVDMAFKLFSFPLHLCRKKLSEEMVCAQGGYVLNTCYVWRACILNR